MIREDALICALCRLMEHRNAWRDSKLETLPDVFREAIAETIELFQGGEIPRECVKVFGIVERMKLAWDEFEMSGGAVPGNKFWDCLSKIEEEVTYAPPEIHDSPVEPIAQLLQEKVTARMIAVIYSHDGKGPFMKNGQPQEHLVRAEIAKPGSILGQDFVHPRIVAEQERLKRYDNYVGRRAQVLRAEAAAEVQAQGAEASDGGALSAPPVGPETIEELLLTGVDDRQILKIKRCTQQDINVVKLQIEAAKQNDVSTAQLSELETAITAHLGQHPKATNSEIAEKLGIEVKLVRSIRRKSQEAVGQ